MSAPDCGVVRFVEAAGIRLRAVLDGAGVPVLVLHGFTGAAESMAGVAEALAPSHHVVRLELVGHGESEAPVALEAYSMDACSAQIAAAARGLDLDRPHLVGYSMGGRAALAAASARPEAFASLTLVGATAGIADAAARRERIAADEALADRIERDGVEAFVDQWMALPIFASQARLGADVLALARAQRLRSCAKGLGNSLRGMGAGAQAPLHDRLARLALPVLLVVGEQDAKFRALAGELEAALPDARTQVLPDAGHAAHLEAPAAFAASVRTFLATVATSGSEAQSAGATPVDGLAIATATSVGRSLERANE